MFCIPFVRGGGASHNDALRQTPNWSSQKVSYKQKNYKCALLLTLVKTCVPADGVASLPKSYKAATPSPHR